jgi:hypothetical protein
VRKRGREEEGEDRERERERDLYNTLQLQQRTMAMPPITH